MKTLFFILLMSSAFTFGNSLPPTPEYDSLFEMTVTC